MLESKLKYYVSFYATPLLLRRIHIINNDEQWVWFAVEEGSIDLTWAGNTISMKETQTCFLPAGVHETVIRCQKQIRCLWVAMEGPLAPMVVRKMGALLHMPLKQGALPSQMYLAKQIVQVMVRHSGTADATYQLQHLMYGMLASHWGALTRSTFASVLSFA